MAKKGPKATGSRPKPSQTNNIFGGGKVATLNGVTYEWAGKVMPFAFWNVGIKHLWGTTEHEELAGALSEMATGGKGTGGLLDTRLDLGNRVRRAVPA